MATLLRKAKSTMHSHFDITLGKPPRPLPKDKVSCAALQSQAIREVGDIDTGTFIADSSPGSPIFFFQPPERAHKQRSIAQLRRRLVRKASTFSLRNNNNIASSTTAIKHPTSESRVLARAAVDIDSSCRQHPTRPSSRSDSRSCSKRATQDPRTFAASTDQFGLTASEPATVTGTERLSGIANEGEAQSCGKEGPAQPQLEREAKKNNQDSSAEGQTGWRKMAAPTVEPPVAYEKLKQITTDACDTALSSVTKYNHSDTESWNTSIINTILGALVNETSSESAASNGTETAPPQPSFKFVVNSTIIQHGATSTSEDGKTSGRRGMHSASGAYWNNEKDGMWSFKYEAAEAKGLDVVIGIIWIWVG